MLKRGLTQRTIFHRDRTLEIKGIRERNFESCASLAPLTKSIMKHALSNLTWNIDAPSPPKLCFVSLHSENSLSLSSTIKRPNVLTLVTTYICGFWLHVGHPSPSPAKDALTHIFCKYEMCHLVQSETGNPRVELRQQPGAPFYFWSLNMRINKQDQQIFQL